MVRPSHAAVNPLLRERASSSKLIIIEVLTGGLTVNILPAKGILFGNVLLYTLCNKIIN